MGPKLQETGWNGRDEKRHMSRSGLNWAASKREGEREKG